MIDMSSLHKETDWIWRVDGDSREEPSHDLVHPIFDREYPVLCVRDLSSLDAPAITVWRRRGQKRWKWDLTWMKKGESSQICSNCVWIEHGTELPERSHARYFLGDSLHLQHYPGPVEKITWVDLAKLVEN